MKDGLPIGTLWVIVEAKLENVLHIPGVACDSDEALFPGEEGDGSDASLVSAATGAEVVCNPIMHAIGVLDEPRKAPQ